ncbi:MAG: 50S ribosomal protein L4 [Candidatus Vogelbacteria bacterium]|nr:50S ribosomal protein L4 [Candidatus Vogelbacteria bacterium]
MDAKLYNQEGKEVGKVNLPERIFHVRWNGDLVHQVVVAMQANQRQGTADTKGRGEVRGGGKKPWRQKGTGRARHGSIRSPLWRGGGVTHGPTAERNYSQKINKKMKTKALFTVLAQKWRDGDILLVDKLALAEVKTKAAAGLLKQLATVSGFAPLGYKKGKRALVAVPAAEVAVRKSFQNISTVAVDEVRNLNPLDLLQYRYLVLCEPEKSLDLLKQRS